MILRERFWGAENFSSQGYRGEAHVADLPMDHFEQQAGESLRFQKIIGELIRQEALLDKLFTTVPEAIVVLDNNDSILRVNPEFTKIFGYAEEEALGRPLNQLVVPEELWAEAEKYTRHGIRGEILNVETVRKRKDGTRVPVSIVGVPVSIAGSRVSEYVIYRDITQQKRGEQRLRQSEAY